MSGITYPPEMLPSPLAGEEADVVLVHPDTGKQTTVFSTSGTTNGKPGTPGQAYTHGKELTAEDSLKAELERKETLPPSYDDIVQARKIKAYRERLEKRKGR